MVDKISKDKYHDLCQSNMYDNTDAFHRMLEQITGIIAKPYTVYNYYDETGMYVGNSDDSTLRDLLDNAFIEIEDMMVY